MSDTPALSPATGHVPPPRPVSLFTIVFLFAVFAAFLLVIRYYYRPADTPAFVSSAENLSKDLQWKADRESRKKTLGELRAAEAQKISDYSWANKDAGVVQLPIERAMELTAQKYGAKK